MLYIYIYIYIYIYAIVVMRRMGALDCLHDVTIYLYIYIYIYIYIKLLNFVKLSTLLIEKSSRKRYAKPTALVAVSALWSFKIFI